MALTLLNEASDQSPITDRSSITLRIPPKTDIYASPSLGFPFSAPIAYTTLPTASLTLARTTISLPLVQPKSHTSDSLNRTQQFDQGGLIFVQPHPSHPSPSAAESGSDQTTASGHTPPKWVKAGIEFYNGHMRGSVVVRDRWADWSLFEVPQAAFKSSDTDGIQTVSITLEADRLDDALAIWLVVPGSDRMPVRKILWWFLKNERQDNSWVGVYGARPDPNDETKENLEVRFDGFEVRSS